jgi:hypothetical protein
MNLDELVNSIPESEAELKSSLKHWVESWKQDDRTTDELGYSIGKWHGNVWFKDTNISNKFYSDFMAFKREAIEGIGGMTINERLYHFSLFEKWGQSNENQKAIIYRKLKANA